MWDEISCPNLDRNHNWFGCFSFWNSIQSLKKLFNLSLAKTTSKDGIHFAAWLLKRSIWENLHLYPFVHSLSPLIDLGPLAQDWGRIKVQIQNIFSIINVFPSLMFWIVVISQCTFLTKRAINGNSNAITSHLSH